MSSEVDNLSQAGHIDEGNQIILNICAVLLRRLCCKESVRIVDSECRRSFLLTGVDLHFIPKQSGRVLLGLNLAE